MSAPNSSSSAFALSLLREYTHTLDALPIDLSKNFAELRELDAVLSTAMSTLTSKITLLTDMIERGKGQQEERLWLLIEIAEEAQRLRLGGEDKIRVAYQAADNLKTHSQHLGSLAEHIPGFDFTTLNRHTTYPHVASRSFMPPATLETGRRRRTGFASLLTSSAPDPTPVKRKRVNARDDDQTPRKVDRFVDGSAPRPRGGGRKRIERPPSPTESVLSVTSHLPPNGIQTTARPGPGPRRTSSRPMRAANEQVDYYDGPPASGPPPFNVPPSSAHAHPSLAYQHQNGHATPFDLRPPEWPQQPPQAQTQALEGPGMPGGDPEPDSNTTAVDGDAEDNENDKPYCICQRPSAGDMIACDDDGCPFEWFHLSCLGLEITPDGTWYCDTCKPKHRNKRGGGGRGGRRKAAGGRTRG
ncbi:hypothetical protein FB45DRAFT_928004 [Roridomyces roridus]|uniref:Chromatin modification-related protein n=1 Tax=Roridomyces roridus TaxID=1738132 RepID=A0AAD7FHS6_9AGAR|nr:hypothetical protein FB45DRAFT_928004 [Roridomyces roridus]